MEKYVSAAALYLLGMCLYFVYNLFIKNTPQSLIEAGREGMKETPFQFSDGVLLSIAIVVDLICSFVWPITTIFDAKTTLKGESEND